MAGTDLVGGSRENCRYFCAVFAERVSGSEEMGPRGGKIVP